MVQLVLMLLLYMLSALTFLSISYILKLSILLPYQTILFEPSKSLTDFSQLLIKLENFPLLYFILFSKQNLVVHEGAVDLYCIPITTAFDFVVIFFELALHMLTPNIQLVETPSNI